MKTILILIILLALSISLTWGQIVDGDGIILDTCTEEEAIAILKAFGDYKHPDTLTHYQVIDTTVDSMLWPGRWVPHSSKPNHYVQELVWIFDTTIDTTWHKKIPVMLTPDEYKRLMEMLKPKDTGYPLIWENTEEPFKPGYWENINGRMGQITELGDTIWSDREPALLVDSVGIFDTAFKKADKEFKNIEDRWNEIQDRKHPTED